MVQIPMLRPRTVKPNQQFGVSLAELQERSLVDDGVPRVLRRMVEHLRKHGEKNHNRKEKNKLKLYHFIKHLDYFGLRPLWNVVYYFMLFILDFYL